MNVYYIFSKDFLGKKLFILFITIKLFKYCNIL